MTFTIRPAVREFTPLIIGASGPTKSGKTYSAHRLAAGLAQGGKVIMLNAEGKRGHQYADKFKYLAVDIEPPYAPARYTEALKMIKAEKPACVIIDSASHMHDGPGGMLEMHDNEVDRMAGDKVGKAREAYNWTGWIKPKKTENEFIYTMLALDCHVVLCFRAKEKMKITRGKDPEDMGFQPIASDRVAFETMVTLLLPPHCGGVPDKAGSDLREPFDTLIPWDRPLDESLGAKLAAWAAGGGRIAPKPAESTGEPPDQPEEGSPGLISVDQVTFLEDRCREAYTTPAKLCAAAEVPSLRAMPAEKYHGALKWLEKVLDAKRERG